MTKKIRVMKDFTYSSIIKEAITTAKDRKATSAQIFDYITKKHPNLFKESNSMTWKGNIRQLLSKSPEFIKLKKDQNSKLHFWKYIPIEEIFEEENRINNSSQIVDKIEKEPQQMPIYYNNYKYHEIMGIGEQPYCYYPNVPNYNDVFKDSNQPLHYNKYDDTKYNDKDLKKNSNEFKFNVPQ